MKIKVVKSKLVEGLALVKDACEGKDALNILRCVRMDASENAITLTASNLDVTVTTQVECEVVDPGSVALVGSSLFCFANALPEGVVEIELKDGATSARISGGSCRYALAIGDVSQWPKPAEIKGNGASYSIQSLTLKDIFRKVKYAASVDDTRRALKGVNIATTEDRLTAVATDGRRLSCVEVEIETSGASSTTIPSKTVGILERIMGKGDQTIEVITDGKQMLFGEREAKWSVQTKLIDEVYPQWRRVIPAELTNTARVDRGILNEEIGRVALSVNPDVDKCVKMTVGDGRIVLEAKNNNFSRAKTELAVKYDGSEISFNVNPDLVKDILGCVDDDEMEISFGNGTAPIVFKSAIPFVGVMMPLRG